MERERVHENWHLISRLGTRAIPIPEEKGGVLRDRRNFKTLVLLELYEKTQGEGGDNLCCGCGDVL